MIRKIFILLAFQLSFSQNYWQQHVEYEMDIVVDVSDFTYDGNQSIIYTNNSNDTIKKVYYHLFFNAFKPNSQMDIRSRTIRDPDRRVGSRIVALEENLEAMNMFKNPDDIPEQSPIKNIDKEKINQEIDNLDKKKISILNEIEEILRK